MTQDKRKQVASRLKPLCNNPELWDALQAYIDYQVYDQSLTLERSEDIHKVYKAQGAIAALRKLKYMREEANGK